MHTGVRGFVYWNETCSQTTTTTCERGLYSLPNAQLLIKGNPVSVRVGPEGDFWRPLAPGDYVLVASALGYARTRLTLHLLCYCTLHLPFCFSLQLPIVRRWPLSLVGVVMFYLFFSHWTFIKSCSVYRFIA